MAEDGFWYFHTPVSARNHYSDFMLVCFDMKKCVNSSGDIDYFRNEFLLRQWSVADKIPSWDSQPLNIPYLDQISDLKYPLPSVFVLWVGLIERSSF